MARFFTPPWAAALASLLFAVAAASSCGTDSSGGGASTTSGEGAATSGTGGQPSLPPTSVTVHLQRIAEGAGTISFGVPVPKGALASTDNVLLTIGGVAWGFRVAPLLFEHDAAGKATSVRAFLVQLPAAAMPGDAADVDISFTAKLHFIDPSPVEPFASLAVDAPEQIEVATRTISLVGGAAQLVETANETRTLFTGKEPRVLATFPPGYLATTGILGPLLDAEQASKPALAGMGFLSAALTPFALSAMYQESYRVDAFQDPNDGYAGAVIDPVANYEGWLYDRCATFVTAYVHTGDARFLRHAYRSCSYYSSKVILSGENAGIWSGKPDPDTKYSHLRGLYAYYALTGDEGVLASGKAIADMWRDDPAFVVPYRQGHIHGPDKLWTERLLAHSLEGLYYGHRLLDDPSYLSAAKELLDTAFTHLTTGDQATLDTLTSLGGPGYPSFPPQNCFIHSALQHAEGEAVDPWCSGWMSELLTDVLLAYQDQTGDPRVDEIFVRLARFLRDTGTSYFDANPADDTFLEPSICYDPAAGEDARRLVPLYGAGRTFDKTRKNQGEYDDFEHCADATALTAAAIRALKRTGHYDEGGPIGPFPSEGASFLALHHELASCAQRTFAGWHRPKRDPAAWSSEELGAGLGDPASFIRANKIGWPSHPSVPLRKLSWWFNMSMLQFALLDEAGVTLAALEPGAVKGAGCP
jgi:hypothetical protein